MIAREGMAVWRTLVPQTIASLAVIRGNMFVYNGFTMTCMSAWTEHMRAVLGTLARCLTTATSMRGKGTRNLGVLHKRQWNPSEVHELLEEASGPARAGNITVIPERDESHCHRQSAAGT